VTNFMASHPAQVTLWGGLVGGPGKPMLQVSHVTCVVQLSSDLVCGQCAWCTRPQ
jgi:hypothetical protein